MEDLFNNNYEVIGLCAPDCACDFCARKRGAIENLIAIEYLKIFLLAKKSRNMADFLNDLKLLFQKFL